MRRFRIRTAEGIIRPSRRRIQRPNATSEPPHRGRRGSVRVAEPSRRTARPSALLRIDPQGPQPLGEPIGASIGLFGASVLLLGPGIGLLGPEPMLLGADAGLNDLWGLGGSADLGDPLGLAVQAYSLDQSSRRSRPSAVSGATADSGGPRGMATRPRGHVTSRTWPRGRVAMPRSNRRADCQNPLAHPDVSGRRSKGHRAVWSGRLRTSGSKRRPSRSRPRRGRRGPWSSRVPGGLRGPRSRWGTSARSTPCKAASPA